MSSPNWFVDVEQEININAKSHIKEIRFFDDVTSTAN